MKLESLKLTNFRSHLKTEFALNRINILRSGHGGGKSSTALAIEYCLTGRNSLTDARGAGAENLIHLGQKQLAVEIKTGGVTITRTRSSAGGQFLIQGNGKSMAGKEAELLLQKNFGSPEVLSAVFNATHFCRMNEKEQKALLAGALASDPVEIEASILDGMPALVFNGNPLTTVSSAAECDRLHSIVFDLRADRKRELKALGDLAEPEIPKDCPELGAVTLQLAELEQRKNDLTRLVSRNLLAVQEANAKKREAYNDRRRKFEQAQSVLKEYAGCVIETGEELANLQKKLKGQGEAKKLEALIADVKAKQSTLLAENKKLSAPLQTECPTCHRDYTDLPDYSQRLAEIDKEFDELSAALTKHQEALRKLPDFALIEERLRKHQEAMPKIAAAEVIIRDVGDCIEPEYPAANTAEMDAEIANLATRIGQGREIERQVVRYEEQRKQYDGAKSKRAELEKIIGKLEVLVEYFSDRGPIKAKLVGGKLPAFVERINGVLERFGFSCEFTLEPYALTVQLHEDGRMLTVAQLSESEEFRFGVAFAVALAEATGVGMVIIDRGDILLTQERSELTAALMESNLDQVFLLAAGEPMDSAPPIPDTTFFELQNVNGVTSIRAQFTAEDSELVYGEQ